MNRFKNSAAGFTLVELLIVVIIVAVLAAVGNPLMRGNVDRAKLSEADAGLGTLRGAIRAYTAQNTTCPTTANMNTITKIRTLMNLKLGDLTGRYFEDNNYTYTGTPGDATATPHTSDVYCISATGNTPTAGETGATAPKSVQAKGLNHSMDQDGTIYLDTVCTDATKVIN